jgi:hypothetical protein
LKKTAKNALFRWGLEGVGGCISFVKRFEGTPSGKQRKQQSKVFQKKAKDP